MLAIFLTANGAQAFTLNTGWVKDCGGGLLLPDADHGRKRYRIRTPFTGVGAAGDGMQKRGAFARYRLYCIGGLWSESVDILRNGDMVKSVVISASF